MQNDLVNPKLQATKTALDRVSGSFCLAKWLQSTVHLHNGNTQSCHHVRSHKIGQGDLHNTDRKLTARAQMLAGQRPKECAYCWTAEDRGRASDRILKSSADWALPFIDEVLKSGEGEAITPRYLEVSFDSACGFKCMYCGPAYSSSWKSEIERHGPYPTSRRYNNLTMLKLNGVLPLPEGERQSQIGKFWDWWPGVSEELHDFRITGGEPFQAPQTFEVLEWLASNPRPRLKLALNSNMSLGEAKLDRFLTALNALSGNVRSFTLFTSVDSVGARAEYIRHGLDFNRYVANVERVLNEARWPIQVSYMITVNALALSGLRDLMALIIEQRRRHPRHMVLLDTPYLQNPAHLSVEILTPEFTRYLEETVAFMKAEGFTESEILKVDRIRELILKPRHSRLMRAILRRDFRVMMQEHDRRRGTDFAATFPEYVSFLGECRLWEPRAAL